MLPSKTEAWCRNTKSKISFQLTRDGFHRVWTSWVDGAKM
jgi:hypothetical protein